jgi:hypothetical protein
MAGRRKPARAVKMKSKTKAPAKGPKKRKSKTRMAKSPARRGATKKILEIKLDDWSQFEATIRRKLGNRELVVRNFQRIVFDSFLKAGQMEVDLLPVVRKTGTDRLENADVWNATGFDHEHDRHPTGMKPNDLIYASWLDFRLVPYKASRAQGDNTVKMEAYDLTEGYTEFDALIVYDPARLKRVSANEYWFRTTPLDAALLLLTVKE